MITDLTYNPNQLQFVSFSDYATSFPEIWIQTPEAGSISEVRSTNGGSVSGNKVVVTYTFKSITSGTSTIEVTGKANANNSELALSKGVLSMNFTPAQSSSTSPTTSSGSTTPSSQAPSSQQNTTNQNGQPENSTGSTTEIPDSIGVVEDSSTSGQTKSALGQATSIVGKVTTIGTDNKFISLAVVSGLLILVMGTWLGLRARGRAQYAKHFPDMHTTLFSDTSGGASSSAAPQINAKQPIGNMSSSANGVQHTIPQPASSVQQQPIQSVIDPVVIRPTVQVTPAVPEQPLPANKAVVMPENTVGQPNEPPKEI